MNLNKELKFPVHHQPSNRLKTLHSLLYVDHKTVDINPIKTSLSRDIDSILSEYHIPSNPSMTSLNNGFIIKPKPKSTETSQESKRIDSWDDI